MRHTHPSELVPGGAGRPGLSALTVTGVRVDPTHAHVMVDGRLDLSTIELLTGLLEAQLRLGRRHVRMDLSQATVADAGCLRHLTAVHQRFLTEHGLLVLDPVSVELFTLLEITGLDRTLFVSVPDSPTELPRLPALTELIHLPASAGSTTTGTQGPAAPTKRPVGTTTALITSGREALAAATRVSWLLARMPPNWSAGTSND